jgi:hypothetical protein
MVDPAWIEPLRDLVARATRVEQVAP